MAGDDAVVTWKLPWRGGSTKTSVPKVGDPDLVVVVEGSDDAVPSSVALAEAGFADQSPVVVRHLLWVGPAEVEAVAARGAASGYEIDAGVPVGPGDVGPHRVVLARVEVVDAVSLSRERSRMASLASRVGGRVDGWAVLRAGDTPVTDDER